MTSLRSAAEKPSTLYRSLLDKLPDASERVQSAAPVSTPELLADIAAARVFPQGFTNWLKYWRFRSREAGVTLTFRDLWPGQRDFRDIMIDVADKATQVGIWQGIFALKAGKLGFTELETAWDGYVLWARRNARVHLFSKEEQAAKDMLGYVRFGLQNLEPAFGVVFLDSNEREVAPSQAGTKQFRLTVLSPDGTRDFGDTRNAIAYATSKNPAIDQSATHAHVDEWAHMLDPKGAWGSISTTVAPTGTCHIVTRGAGENQDVENTWAAAVGGQSQLRAFFAPWTARPDRDQDWLVAQAGSMPTLAALSHYAAETPEDAFRGDEDNDFVPIEVWDRCAELICCAAGHYRDGTGRDAWQPASCEDCRTVEQTGIYSSYLATHPLTPDDPNPMILGVDAGVTRDNFAVCGVTRHPLRHDDPAIRVRRHWTPDDFEDGVIDFPTVEAWLRTICDGGCELGHPQYAPWKGGAPCKPRRGQIWEPGQCPACAAGALVPAWNVYCLAYDPYQLVDMMQALQRDGIFCYEFQQGKERAEADRTLFDVIIGRRLGHTGDDALRRHISNAKAKTQRDEDSKLRVVKKAPHRPIDLVVAASMAVARCLYYNL